MSKRFAGIAVVAALAGAFWAARETRAGLAAQHALQSFFKPYSMVTTLAIDGVGDVPLFVNPDDQVITPWLWAGRVWEETETHWFVQSLRPGDVVVDVGANVGYYTVLAGRLVGDAGRVYAFEPDPVSFAIMQRNVRLSGLRNVVLEPKAVSNEPGSIRLFLSDKNKGDHRIYQPEGEQRDFIEVEAVPLDADLEGVEGSLDFVHIDPPGAARGIKEGLLGHG